MSWATASQSAASITVLLSLWVCFVQCTTFHLAQQQQQQQKPYHINFKWLWDLLFRSFRLSLVVSLRTQKNQCKRTSLACSPLIGLLFSVLRPMVLKILLLLLLAIKQSCASFCWVLSSFLFLLSYFHSTPKRRSLTSREMKSFASSAFGYAHTNVFRTCILERTSNAEHLQSRANTHTRHASPPRNNNSMKHEADRFWMYNVEREKRVANDGKNKTKDPKRGGRPQFDAGFWIVVLIVISFCGHLRFLALDMHFNHYLRSVQGAGFILSSRTTINRSNIRRVNFVFFGDAFRNPIDRSPLTVPIWWWHAYGLLIKWREVCNGLVGTY